MVVNLSYSLLVKLFLLDGKEVSNPNNSDGMDDSYVEKSCCPGVSVWYGQRNQLNW